MTRRLSVVISIMALLAVSMAPAGAKSGVPHLRGYMDLDFNLGLVIPAGGAQDVSWVGTVEFDGVAYPIAFFPTAPLVEQGRLLLFEEVWRIYDSLDYTYEDGVVATFTPGSVILAGTDKGAVLPNGRALSFGAIETANGDADPHGILDDVKVGDRVFWRGRFLDETQMEFAGPFRIFISPVAHRPTPAVFL